MIADCRFKFAGSARLKLESRVPGPNSLLGWIPCFWTRVIFPGKPDAVSAWRWTPLFILILTSGVLHYPGLGHFLFEPDEGRYAQIPREMLTSGDWIVPTLQGEPYLEKPPLFYWLVMGCYAVFGFHDWAARLVPALAVQGCLVMTYLFGRRMLGERPAFWGALLLALMPGFVGMGRLLVLDGVLTFLVTLALFSGWRALEGPALQDGWWLTAAVACGLGVLTKGPIALVLLLAPVWLQRRLAPTPARIGLRGWLKFAGVTLAVALPWYAVAAWRLPDFVHDFFWVHNVQRFAEPFNHDRPAWFYVPVLLAGLGPLSFLLIPFGRWLVLRDGAGRCPALGYLLLSAAWCLLFFSLSGCKLPTYILPAFPPLALALGAWLARSPLRQSRWLQGGLAAWGLVMAMGMGLIVPALAKARSPMADWQHMQELCADKSVPVFCFPRHIDSVAFYTGRSDFVAIHTRDWARLVSELDKHPRAVVLGGHRHSLKSLEQVLPAELSMRGTVPMGLCEMALVELID
jgi:4-amino-4-deoxy-L-arabinose transferase-like glycosyltransferase